MTANVTVTCAYCRYHGDFDAFTSTTIGGDLPPGQYQCPNCNRAWKIRHGRIYIFEDRRGKFLVNEPSKLIPAEARL